MATERKPNVIVGAGRLYIDVLDAGGAPSGGERYMGSSSGFTISSTTEDVTLYDDDGPVGAVLDQVVTQLTRTFSATLRDVSMDNLALFVIGDAGTQTDEATAVTDESYTVQPGRHYQLGVSDDKPMGVRSVTSVTVKDKDDKAIAAKDNYEVDAANARIYIVPGGAIAASAVIKVSYTPVAAAIPIVTGGDLKAVRAALRYIEDPVAGQGRNYYVPNSSVRPSGASSIKTEGRRSAQTMQFEFSINKPASGPT